MTTQLQMTQWYRWRAEKMEKMIEDGKTLDDICKAFSVTLTTVNNYLESYRAWLDRQGME